MALGASLATIVPRKRKDGSISYTAQIRLKVEGKRYSETKTGSDRKALDRWARRREDELREPGAIERLSHAGTKVGWVLECYMEDFQGASKFGRSKLSHIKYLIGHPELSELDAINLTPAQLIQFARSRAAGGAGPSTINNDFIWLRNAMRAVRLSRDIPLNLQAVDDAAFLLRKERVIARSRQRDRRPALGELESLLEYFSSRDGRARIPMTDVSLFGLFSSRREDEICTIKWDDLDERRRGVLVRDMKHPRENRDTFCFLTDPAWAVIRCQPKIADEIFPYNSKSVGAAWARSCRFLEIEDLHFHDLRHECISWLFELGWDIPRVASVSGHKSWSSLQRYTHLRESGPHDKYAGWEWLPVTEE